MKKTVYGFIMVMALSVLLAGCDQVTDALTTPGNKDDAFVAVTNITLSETSRVKNMEIDLNALAVVTPENATVKGPIKWFVIDAGDTEVATGAVAGGTLTPTAAGTFTLSATIEGAIAEGAEDYEKLTGLSITVTEAFVPVTDITWTVTTGKTGVPLDLSGASAVPTGATNSTITWTAEGAGLSGTVSGSVTPTAAETLTLTATIVNGTANGTENFTKDFTVTVSEGAGVDLSGVTLDSVIADGAADVFAATTKVTLTFSGDVPGLEAGHITLAADEATMTKGTLVSKGSGVYELPVDALLNAGPNAGKAFTVTVSDGANTPLTGTVTLYAWIAVATKDALVAIGTDATTLAGWYKQTADITINDDAWAPIGGTAVEPFTGHFVGSDYIDNGEKKSYKIYPTIASSSDNVGIFGYTSGATFENIHIGEGSIATTGTGKSAGGIAVSVLNGSVITNCSNAAAITSLYNAGGICASTANAVEIKNCSNSGNITVTQPVKNSNSRAGGICGLFGESKIIACSNTGAVALTGIGRQTRLGGIVGETAGEILNEGQIIACYNTGTVSTDVAQQSTGQIYLGGIYGRNVDGYIAITACYNTGDVKHTGETDTSGSVYLGGIGGYQGDVIVNNVITKAAVITACYWKSESNPNYGIGGRLDLDHTTATTAMPDSTGTFKFSNSAWPATGNSEGQSDEWGTGDGSGSGNYWASLGSYGGDYPRLWFEN